MIDAVARSGLPASRSLPLAEGRVNFRSLIIPLAAAVGGVDVLDAFADAPARRIPVRFYLPHGERTPPATIFFHGGGWVFGDLSSHDALCRALAVRSRSAVVAVDYRRAPEHPYPAALDDCYAATVWVAAHGDTHGIDQTRICVAGDSAGGNLAAAVALRARAEGGPSLRAQVLAYPALHPSPPASNLDTSLSDPFLTREEMDWFWNCYLGGATTEVVEYAAPALAGNLTGLPPAIVVTAGIDPLLDEVAEFSARLCAAGVEVRALHYEQMVHGFLLFTRYLDTARSAIRDIGQAISEAFGARHGNDPDACRTESQRPDAAPR